MKNYLILLGFACITACTHTEKGEQSSLIYMKIEKPNMSSLQPLLLSEFADSIEYLQLETNSKCLISYPSPIERVGNKIFLRSGGDIFQFDMTGKFICQIGRIGQGPGEFTHPRYSVDEANGKVFIKSHSAKSPMSFDFDGNYLGNLKDSLLVSCWGVLTELGAGNGYLIYANNLVNAADQWACQPYELMVYDYINHQMIQGLTNKMVCLPPNNSQYWIQPGLQMLLKQGDMHYYKSFYNDTLYAVNGEGIFPNAVIDLGSRKYPADFLWTNGTPPTGKEGKILISDAYICHNYLLIDCYLYRSSRETDYFICKYNKNTGDLTYHPYFIINDIDGGSYVSTSILRSGIKVVDVETEQEEIISDKSDKVTLKYPELKEKFELMKKNRDADDNPILMWVKVKSI
jgi:hypothetical protein